MPVYISASKLGIVLLCTVNKDLWHSSIPGLYLFDDII